MCLRLEFVAVTFRLDREIERRHQLLASIVSQNIVTRSGDLRSLPGKDGNLTESTIRLRRYEGLSC